MAPTDANRFTAGDSDAAAEIEIDSNIYPEDAALKTAYALSDRCLVHFRYGTKGCLIAKISSLPGGIETITELTRQFSRTLTDFALRSRIAEETRDIQETLLRRAFSQALTGTG